jgi:hypothetical protein
MNRVSFFAQLAGPRGRGNGLFARWTYTEKPTHETCKEEIAQIYIHNTTRAPPAKKKGICQPEYANVRNRACIRHRQGWGKEERARERDEKQDLVSHCQQYGKGLNPLGFRRLDCVQTLRTPHLTKRRVTHRKTHTQACTHTSTHQRSSSVPIQIPNCAACAATWMVL